MISKIKENRPYEFISIQHIGEIVRGKEKMYPKESQGFENYMLNEVGEGTEVVEDLVNVPAEFEGMSDDMWPKTLTQLKEIAER